MRETTGSLRGTVTALVNIPIANNISTGFFPIGLGYVASSLSAAGAEVLVVDPQGEQLTETETLARLAGWIRDWDVRFFGLSSMITGYEYAKGIARGIKEVRLDAIVYIGGSISAATELLLSNSHVDIVCQGEGEESAVELLRTLTARGDPSGVPGIAFRKDGEVRFTTARERIPDLGRLAFPAWDKFPVEYYITTPKIVQGVARGMSLASTRGCPYKCGFCYRSFGRITRTRPAKDVARELETMVERYDVHHFEFVDELFTQDPGMVKELCAEIRARELNITWRCLARVNPIEKEMLTAMREAGCHWVGFGIESGSQQVLNAMGKGVRVDHARRAIGLAREAGLQVSGTFIIGYPGETEETVAETIRFCKEMELANRPFFPVPYPGTLLYERLRAEGRVQDEENFIERICGNATELLVNISGMTDEELIELRDRFVDELGQFFPALIHPDAVNAGRVNAILPRSVDRPYTRQQDPRVQALVAADIQRCVKIIAAGLPGCTSIILTGGFGRGEGGVIVEGNEIAPVNDYDFVAVVEKAPPPEDLRELRQRAARDSAIDHVDVLTINRDDLSGLAPYQFNYDMKHGGRVVWGEDSLELIPEYQPAEIPLDSCTLVLVNRVICLLECYSEDYAKRDLSEHERFYLANQTAKAVLGAVEALLIRAGKYHHSYAERAALFHGDFPGQDDLVEWATDFKLFPRRRPRGDVVRLWRRSADWYFTVLASFPCIFGYDPRSESSPKRARAALLQELLSERNGLHPIENVEMYLLAYRVAGFWQKGRFLRMARKALGEISGVGYGRSTWEEVRRETVKLWHETLG